MRRIAPFLASAVLTVLPAGVAAHAPSVLETATTSPGDPVVLDDPTLSRAIGATIDHPGEVDWYRLDLAAGEPLVVGMTAPDTNGAVAATFTLVGPGLPAAAGVGPEALSLAEMAGVDGAVVFEPSSQPPREVHGGLGFINYGSVRLEAPVEGSYYVAVRAVEPGATGKYVLAPGVREEFGLDAVGGMVDLVSFFNAPWDDPNE
jgi:hypothetical protein